MKRLHVHVAVDDIKPSVKFYSALFAAEPTVLKDDYAKRMLEDPRVNFAISRRGAAPGIEHLGIQVETWEAFLTSGENETYGQDPVLGPIKASACCSPETPQGQCCPPKPELAADAPCCGASAAR